MKNKFINTAAAGGNQIWVTVSHVVSLSLGIQPLRNMAAGSGWNINWFKATLLTDSK